MCYHCETNLDTLGTEDEPDFNVLETRMQALKITSFSKMNPNYDHITGKYFNQYFGARLPQHNECKLPVKCLNCNVYLNKKLYDIQAQAYEGGLLVE